MTSGRSTRVRAVTPFLWFDGQAEPAARWYTSLIAGSRLGTITRIPGAGGRTGPVLTVEFTLGRIPFVALNGGPEYHHTPAFSIQLACAGQAEVDRLYSALLRGGKESRCGWLTDRFGLSWQVMPEKLPSLIGGPDPAAAARAMEAMMKMRKLDLETLERAYRGEGATERRRASGAARGRRRPSGAGAR
jgi:predicted 3-demethylubiquinone-9 3-methyltransferase (glyoxalase superfamily)